MKKYELFDQTGNVIDSKEVEQAQEERDASNPDKKELKDLTQEIPDIYSELVDALGPSVEAKLSASLKAKLARKKELRG